MTLREALAAAAARIAEWEDLRVDAGRDAELLLLDTLDAPKTLLFTDPGRVLSGAEVATYEAAVARRAAGEPIQYITGQQEFYGLKLRVTSAVLIPRPETELLVEAVLARLPNEEPVRIIDVGTGSGAIAIALAHELPEAWVTAVDVSDEALEVARENAAAHGLEARIRFMHSDLMEAMAGEAAFDAVVSNPPYVSETDRESLHAQVREHEPAGALFAGVEGLDIYRRLIPQASAVLRAGGLLAMEFGYGQRDALAGLLDGWGEVEFLDDLQRIPRVVLARRRLFRG